MISIFCGGTFATLGGTFATPMDCRHEGHFQVNRTDNSFISRSSCCEPNGGSVIDLIMAFTRCDLKDAINTLYELAGEPRRGENMKTGIKSHETKNEGLTEAKGAVKSVASQPAKLEDATPTKKNA